MKTIEEWEKEIHYQVMNDEELIKAVRNEAIDACIEAIKTADGIDNYYESRGTMVHWYFGQKSAIRAIEALKEK